MSVIHLYQCRVCNATHLSPFTNFPRCHRCYGKMTHRWSERIRGALDRIILDPKPADIEMLRAAK